MLIELQNVKECPFAELILTKEGIRVISATEDSSKVHFDP
jgi:hypothetical protein